MIDTHAHIYSKKFTDDLPDVLRAAFESGVHKILMPNVDAESVEPMLAIEAAYPGRCLAMMGLHPCSVNENFEKDLELVESWLRKRHFIAVGEMGLDLYWDKSFFAQQKEAFRFQAALAKELALPLVVHSREAMEETISLIEELQDGTLTGVLHCFAGDLPQAKRLIEAGFYLGIGGVATFTNGGLDKVLPHIGLDRLVLETDSPYLAPKPFRGKRNQPAYIPIIAGRVAELTGFSLAQVSETTDRNATALFKLS